MQFLQKQEGEKLLSFKQANELQKLPKHVNSLQLILKQTLPKRLADEMLKSRNADLSRACETVRQVLKKTKTSDSPSSPPQSPSQSDISNNSVDGDSSSEEEASCNEPNDLTFLDNPESDENNIVNLKVYFHCTKSERTINIVRGGMQKQLRNVLMDLYHNPRTSMQCPAILRSFMGGHGRETEARYRRIDQACMAKSINMSSKQKKLLHARQPTIDCLPFDHPRQILWMP